MHKLLLLLLILLFIAPTDNWAKKKDEKKEKLITSELVNGLKFRSIGPALTSGRIVDFAVNPENPAHYFVGVASGNVWKTVNNGTTWEAVFDEEGSYSIGCVTIDPNNPHVVWVGSGENNSQRSVAYGDGIYKSEDGGKSWKNMGLKKSEHIAKIIVDPRDSDHVYVASQGPLWASGGDRGLYETTDGGKSWKAILTVSEHTGVTDLLMDPRDPDVLYAASYQRRRHVWTLINGGPESAIYKSKDGGKNWEKLSSGLPSGDVGRIGLAIAPSNPDIIYAIIEAANDNGGFFRSTDRGASWKKQNKYVSRSPQYYQEILVDPLNPDLVYSLDTWLSYTKDGGKTFKRLGNKNRHVDDHAMWINPKNTDYLLVGGDGGIYESYDCGKNWHFKANLPVTQFYRVSVDNAGPFYNVYGGTQDNFSLGGPSQTKSSEGIVNSDWFVTNGGDGFKTQIDPINPNIVYSQSQYGWLVRFDKLSGEQIGIKPMENEKDEAFRWNWDSPLIISPHSPTRLYFAANKLFRSDDRGDSWQTISPDLTQQLDRDKLLVMGKIWSADAVSKNKSTSPYGTIVSLSESPLKEGLIYSGSDDGLIQVTQDGGKSWSKLQKFADVPANTYVNCLFASQHVEGRVYAAFNNQKMGDFKPYILRSDNYGKSWETISIDLPEKGTIYSVVEDFINANLIFAGTEFGVFFSVDMGENWTQLKNGLPTIAVKDMVIQERENDLVLATFGRGFYILDNYAPLRDLNKEMLEKEAFIFPVKDAHMYFQTSLHTGQLGSSYYRAKNPEFGATFTYFVKDAVKSKKSLRHKKEKELKKEKAAIPFPSIEALIQEKDEDKALLIFDIRDEAGTAIRRLVKPHGKGIQRLTWNLKLADPSSVTSADAGYKPSSIHLAMPGKYNVTMYQSIDGEIRKLAGPVDFKAKVLGQTTLPAEDRAALVAYQADLSKTYRAVDGSVQLIKEELKKINVLKNAYQQTAGLAPEIRSKLIEMEKSLKRIRRVLTGTPEKTSRNIPEVASVNGRLETILWDQWRSTSAPTETQKKSLQIAQDVFSVEYAKIKKIVETDLPAVEKQFENALAPWTPGRLPDWK